IKPDVIQKGIENVKWQCRFEIISTDKNVIVLDGAHNEDGMKTLCDTLKKGFKKNEIVAIVSILKDKDSKKILEILEENVSKIIFTSLSENPRGQSALELFEKSNKQNKDYRENIVEAFNLSKVENKKIILLCGSFYLLSKFKEEVLK
ncbi:MAG: glutamate ligase domain-containing protein, partial [Cetobacterium sp.]